MTKYLSALTAGQVLWISAAGALANLDFNTLATIYDEADDMAKAGQSWESIKEFVIQRTKENMK